ncbi:MAG: M6 family metalloprotease domain-containing protein, partial [Anaerolineae bacterium]|nr:M6 family metalloprotease domain-containing protein [Anaerolineae bacterium]
MQRNHSFRRWGTFFVNTVVVVLTLIALISSGSVSQAAPPQQTPERAPLRVMVPTDQTRADLQAQGYTSLYDLFPSLTAESFQPGPRMPILDKLESAQLSSGPNGVIPSTTFRTLAILVDFSDNVATAPATYFDTLLFGTSSSATVHSFYDESSYGLLDIVTLNLPSTMGWQRMPQAYNYYVDGTNYCTGSYPNNCQKLTEEAVIAVDSVVNFANYDNDGDGYVDTVFVIHAGQGAEAGVANAIWSHSWWVWNEPVHDGVKIGSYTTEPEYWFSVDASTSDMTHGVYVHELGHALGLPDLYDYDDVGQGDGPSAGVGDWSLMAGGSWNGYLGNSPSYFDAWSRVFLGFNDAVNISGTNQTISIPNVVNNQNNSIFRLNGGNTNEYWLLENRQKLGSDAALPGDGLLIWHIDDNAYSNDNQCPLQNNYLCSGPGNHYVVALEQADGLYQLEYKGDISNHNQGNAGDPFPGTTGNTTFNFTSNPNTTSYYTNTDLGVSVSQISASGSTMTAKIGVDPLITDPVVLSSP